RDVKPANVFLPLGDVERAKLIDFGIAVPMVSQGSITRRHAVVGTPGYIAPEQARGGTPVDARCDVFALGCVLFECLAGRAAFAGDSDLARLAKVLLESPPPLGDVCPSASRELEHLAARMLARDPSERPADGGAVARALASLGALERTGD